MRPTEEMGPKYVHLKQELENILKELQRRGENCLPTERELCERYGVSRVTVRRALEELEKAGDIYRIQGKGAFLSKEKFQQPLVYLSSFSEDMKAQQKTGGARVLALETVPASPVVAEKLEVQTGSAVVLLKRLRLVNGEPMAIETCYLTREIGDVVKNHIADNVSLYEIMARECRTRPVSASQSIEVGRLQPWEQSLMGGDIPPYALCMTRQTMDENGKPVEYTESKYRGDNYSYRINFSIEA